MFLPPTIPKGRGEQGSQHSTSTKEEKSRKYELLQSLSKLECELKGPASLGNSQLGQSSFNSYDQKPRSKTLRPELKSQCRSVADSLVAIGKAMEGSKSFYDVSGVSILINA